MGLSRNFQYVPFKNSQHKAQKHIKQYTAKHLKLHSAPNSSKCVMCLCLLNIFSLFSVFMYIYSCFNVQQLESPLRVLGAATLVLFIPIFFFFCFLCTNEADNSNTANKWEIKKFRVFFLRCLCFVYTALKIIKRIL